MKNSIVLTGILLMFSLSAFAQTDYLQFAERSMKNNNTGMIVLGSWAVVNIATGAYGWAKLDGEQKYFHQMNFFWNTVNLSIAGLALYSNLQTDSSIMSAGEIMAKHLKTEKILLINSALDVGYMGTGFLLRHLSTKYTKQSELLKGYGNSLILQGAFLLGFDLCLYSILHSQHLDKLQAINLSLTPEFTGLKLILTI